MSNGEFKMKNLDGKRILVTGGTGSLGRVLLRRLLTGEQGSPKQIVIFSRDETKQHAMRMEYLNRFAAVDEETYHRFQEQVTFRIGDIRDFHSISTALRGIDVLFNAAAMKQVPSCEYFPYEAVQTNISGPANIVRAVRELNLPLETVVSISTDKACKPVNVMGMTKAIQERIFVQANLECPQTRFVCVRYGNVLASRGSVIPLFHEQIKNGGPVTLTTKAMTRFLLSLDQAVDLVFAALHDGQPGETYVPRVPSARITDVAAVLIEDRPVDIKVIGIRPGEKIHEILISEEEMYRTVIRGEYLVILPGLAELREGGPLEPVLEKEYSSGDALMSPQEVRELLAKNNLLI